MGGTILIVEDNEHLRTILATLITHLRYKTIIAASGEEAIEQAVVRQPDLILLDLALPDMPGQDVARAILANPSSSQIPIIGCSSYSDGEQTESALRSGMVAYLQKPIRMRLFEETIKQFIASPK